MECDHVDRRPGNALARKSRLTVLTARPTKVEMAENMFHRLVASGISTDAIAVLLCEPNPNDSIAMEAARRNLAAAGIKAHGVPFLGKHVAGPLHEKGWTIEESARPSPVEEAEAMIGFVQITYLDAPEITPTPRLQKVDGLRGHLDSPIRRLISRSVSSLSMVKAPAPRLAFRASAAAMVALHPGGIFVFDPIVSSPRTVERAMKSQ
jgi:hypothetical protein